MRGMTRLMFSALAAALIAGCGGSTPTAPSGGGNGGGGGGGGGGGDVGGSPPPGSVVVTLGNIFFRSERNRSVNPAVDTVVAGGTVTWNWVSTGAVPHNVESLGTPSFTSSPLKTGDGNIYSLTFSTPGSYRYNCAVHGNMMTGVIVVLAQ